MNRHHSIRSWLVSRAVLVPLLFTGACGDTHAPPRTTPALASAAPDGSCFPVASLPDSIRPVARAALRDFADGEGLYTLAGGLKPVSSGSRTLVVRTQPAPDRVRAESLASWRAALPGLRCGELSVFVQEYAAPIPTSTAGEVRRGSTLIVAHRAALRAEVERHREFWRGLGVDPLTSPEEVLRAVEQAPRADRWRGYGYVFGYPQTAVDFFVSAGLRGDSLDTLIPRDFRRIETYRKFPGRSGAPPTESSFVYAVAKDAPESPVDSALRNAAAPIFADYLRIRPDSMVPIETVLRNWSRVVNHSYPGSANARSR